MAKLPFGLNTPSPVFLALKFSALTTNPKLKSRYHQEKLSLIVFFVFVTQTFFADYVFQKDKQLANFFSSEKKLSAKNSLIQMIVTEKRSMHPCCCCCFALRCMPSSFEESFPSIVEFLEF